MVNATVNGTPILVLRVPEAAIALRLSEPTVWRLVRSGEIPSLKIGGSRLIPVDEVQQWIARQTEEQMAAQFGERRIAS